MKHYISIAATDNVRNLCLRTSSEGISIEIKLTRKEEEFFEDHSNSQTFLNILAKYAKAGIQIKRRKR